MMKNLEVIGQFNREVIVCMANLDPDNVYLILFDQHAVDERIRLETIFLGILISHLCSISISNKMCFVSQPIDRSTQAS